ncbi:MAG TPA: hypothetical protein VNX21_03620, partial [Candidatus Thermoplasmatota archaeon]|nr:hypothetical protein [Candidatus Thermoplasmatota archaeon]
MADVAKEGAGLEALGTVLAVVGWALAALTLLLFARAFLEVSRFGGEAALAVLFSAALGVIVCLALAGLGHLLRATAQ